MCYNEYEYNGVDIMKLMDVYDKVKSPIYNENFIKAIVGIPTDVEKTPTDISIKEQEMSKFVASCFNDWKKNVTSLGLERISRLVSSYNRYDVERFLVFLKSTDDATSLDEVQEFEEKVKYMFPQNLISSLGWNSQREQAMEFQSVGFLDKRFTLQLNFSNGNPYKFMNGLVSKIMPLGIPYSFKVEENQIKLYTDNNNLIKYIETLNEIKENNSDLGICNPNYIAGSIDDSIGIYSSKINGDNYEKVMNSMMESVASDNNLLKRPLKRTIEANANSEMEYEGKKLLIDEYIASIISKRIKNNIMNNAKIKVTSIAGIKAKIKSRRSFSKKHSQKLYNDCLARVRNWFGILGVNNWPNTGLENKPILGFDNQIFVELSDIAEILWNENLANDIAQQIQPRFASVGCDSFKSCFSKDDVIGLREFDQVLIEAEASHTNNTSNATPVVSNPPVSTGPKEVVKVWHDAEMERYFISSDDAKKYSISYQIDPYETHKPVTLTDLEKLQNTYGVELNCSVAELPKQDIEIEYTLDGDKKSYFTKDYIITSVGIKTVLIPRGEAVGNDVLLSKENFDLLTTYYNVTLVPKYGAPSSSGLGK